MLTDEYAPYLRANQYVNYQADSEVVKKAAELVKDKPKSLDKIAAVYQYTVTTLTYDKEKAKTVQSGYLPDVDQVLAEQKGICFDYAAVMTAMLRSQGIPTRLVVGYAGDVYHAWINTFIPQTGWIEGVIYFDGETWKMMDPTFASSAKQSKQIMEYIGNGSNYTAKYLY
jgi:transglutaminase-like putative cysteine protease